jgi:hypothetical protein
MKRSNSDPLGAPTLAVITATTDSLPELADAIVRARAFAEP